jgi:hypothetical protein
VDFQHARISSAMLLPLAALATIFLSRFLPARATGRMARYLVSGLALGAGIWLVREIVAEGAVAQFGPTLEAFRPRRLLTVEVVRVVTSALVLLAAGGLLVGRARPAVVTLAGGVLAVVMVLETGTAADFKLSGPQTSAQAFPFESFNFMNAAPGEFRVPSPAERDDLRERLEADHYRIVLLQDPQKFVARVAPHLSSFWGLRLIEGYSAGLPRRLGMLPFSEHMLSPHDLNIDTSHQMPWRLLAALNVKYVVTVDRSFWYNAEPGNVDPPPFDPRHLYVVENPNPVTPRVFFTERISPATDPLLVPGDDGLRPAPLDPAVEPPPRHCIVEGIASERRFSTSGAISSTFEDDRVVVQVEPSSQERFLVLNELYHPAWHAWVDGKATEIYPTDLVMRGILVPAGATTVELRYGPIVTSWLGLGLLVAGLTIAGFTWWALHRLLRTPCPDRTASSQRA